MPRMCVLSSYPQAVGTTLPDGAALDSLRARTSHPPQLPLLSRLKLIAIGLVLTVALPAALAAQGPAIPAPRGLVNDFADVISAEDEARMTRLIEIVRAGSRGEIAVVTLLDLEGRDVGDVALRIGREWGVGDKAEVGDRARNAGVVVLLVPRGTGPDASRGQISIQVGQGAEGFLTDGIAGDIRREATPLLAQGAYGEGLALITARLAERYAAEFAFSLDSTLVPPRAAREPEGVPPVVFLVIFVVVILVLSRMGRRGASVAEVILPLVLGHRGGGGWGGGGFGGGGFGGFGGGGGFSGGGSSGSF